MRSLSHEARHRLCAQAIRLRTAGPVYVKIAGQTELSRTGVLDISSRTVRCT